MKTFILFLSLFALSFAQISYTEFRLGNLVPKDADPGFYISAGFGSLFDSNLGYNIEIGMFRKSYEKTEKAKLENETETMILFQQSTTMIPIMIKVNYVNSIFDNFLFKSDLGVGYGFLWNSETDYQNKSSSTRFFSDFMWQIGADIGLQISEKGSIFAGVVYNGAELTGESSEKNGLPTFLSKDMSGFGFRLTIRIDGFSPF